MSRPSPFLLLSVILFACTGEPSPDESTLTIAVASNFAETAQELVIDFQERTGIETLLIPGSTGKLTAQIQQGAPYDVLLSADRRAPKFLSRKGLAVSETQLTYALGRLALYSRIPGFVDPTEGGVPEKPIEHLAIANPDLAPYGRAARETLHSLGEWERFESSLVRGESISQAWHFVESGNAELGFVALSQLNAGQKSKAWIVPARYHSPIEQDAILIEDLPNARRFLEFLQSAPTREKIRSHGYELPSLSHAE